MNVVFWQMVITCSTDWSGVDAGFAHGWSYKQWMRLPKEGAPRCSVKYFLKKLVWNGARDGREWKWYSCKREVMGGLVPCSCRNHGELYRWSLCGNGRRHWYCRCGWVKRLSVEYCWYHVINVPVVTLLHGPTHAPVQILCCATLSWCHSKLASTCTAI